MVLREILEAHREEIIGEWVRRLHTEVSERYSSRPPEELAVTVSEAFDAQFVAITLDDFSKMDALIENISSLRLEGGFTLSEVQAAFELWRTIILPVFMKEMEPALFFEAVRKVNDCLTYTIRKFSDYFQELHEKEIRRRASDLECEVEERTKELGESEAKYRMLVEEINDGYFVHQKGVVVFANRAFCDMHGYTVEEALGKSFLNFVAPESRPELMRLYEERMFSEGSRDQYVYLRLMKDGRQLYTENKVKLITYGGEAATAGICRDITERMEIEKHRLRVAELENETKTIALETLHQLMVTLSHYLLNANTIIGGMVRRAERADSGEKRLAALQAIKEQAKRTELVIEALKRVAEIKTSDYSFESHILMIDVKKEIENKLARLEEKEESRREDAPG
jgi:PAS domain S-box-containing protein